MFPNLRSAIISIVVVGLLIVFALFAIDRNNVNRLGSYQKQALGDLQKVRSHIALRFDYAKALSALLEQNGHEGSLVSVVGEFDREQSVADLTARYLLLDEALGLLQRNLYADPAYLSYAPYFEKMYEEELALSDVLLSYHTKAEYFNRQKHAFPALIVANRLEMEDLALFTLAPALKGRP